MTIRHITLASIGALVGILGSVYAGVTTISKQIESSKQDAIRRSLNHQAHDAEIDQRLQRLELAVRLIASDKSSKQQYMLNQIFALKAQQQLVEQSVNQQSPAMYERVIRGRVAAAGATSADAPAASAPASKPEP